MRVIGGDLARRRFDIPKGLNLRPTTDLAKEGLFSSLASLIEIEGKKVLDLFSGTGGIGLEFASRRADRVLCVEKVPKHARHIKTLMEQFEVKEQTEVIVADVFKWLPRQAREETFDIIFADPPYSHPSLSLLPDLILDSDLLNYGGIFILEHPASYHFFESHSHCVKEKIYGEVHFSFFKKESIKG